jgi:hypothetical protein
MSRRTGARRALRLWPWLTVLLVIGLVVGLGGLERRTDTLQPVAIGAEIDSRNLVFTITGATLQKSAPDSADTEWDVQVLGSVRNPNDEALAPILGSTGNFVLHDRASGRTAEPDSVRIGESFNRTLVPPGNSTLPLTITFTLPQDYEPQPGIELGVARMEHTANPVLGRNDDEVTWNVDCYAPLSLLDVPLTRLPDAP